MNRIAIDYAKAIIDQYGLHEFSSPIGKINAATDAVGMKALETYSQHVEKLGEPFSRLNKNELQAVIGTDYYNGGIHTPGCLLIQPAGYIRGLAHGLANSSADDVGNKVDIYEDNI